MCTGTLEFSNCVLHPVARIIIYTNILITNAEGNNVIKNRLQQQTAYETTWLISDYTCVITFKTDSVTKTNLLIINADALIIKGTEGTKSKYGGD